MFLLNFTWNMICVHSLFPSRLSFLRLQYKAETVVLSAYFGSRLCLTKMNTLIYMSRINIVKRHSRISMFDRKKLMIDFKKDMRIWLLFSKFQKIMLAICYLSFRKFFDSKLKTSTSFCISYYHSLQVEEHNYCSILLALSVLIALSVAYNIIG